MLRREAVTGGMILLEQGRPNPNPSGCLFIGVLSGMFSHRAADMLRRRFDEFFNPSASKPSDG